MYQATCSAPGKCILFGEHAVVYGVTAIATALTDLRLYAELEANSSGCICLILKDFNQARLELSLESLQQQFPVSEPLRVLPSPPLEELTNAMKTFVEANCSISRDELCENPSRQVPDQCMLTAVYLLRVIIPELFYSEECLKGRVSGVQIRCFSEGLPVGAGLGSSAAFSVSLAGGLVQLRRELGLPFLGMTSAAISTEEIDTISPSSDYVTNDDISEACLELINGWAYAAECIIHGRPSGLDNYTSCYGGAIKFNKGANRFEKVPKLPTLDILLTNTGVPRSTKALVAGVKELHSALPAVVNPILQSVEAISQRFLQLVDEVNERSDVNVPVTCLDGSISVGATSGNPEVGRASTSQEFNSAMYQLIRVNHCLLASLGVSHPSLELVVSAAAERGLASKLTGAGGGGCAFTFIPTGIESTAESPSAAVAAAADLEQCLRNEHHMVSFRSTLGGHGVKWH